MRKKVREEMARIGEVLLRVWDPLGVGEAAEARGEYDSYVGGVHALLRRGAGEDEVFAHLRGIEVDRMGLGPSSEEALVPVARELLKIGVRPVGYRRRATGAETCTICERTVPFSWWCPCSFRICQECLEENRWGMTCNNITWECPDCGKMRSF
ncbi:MAG: hypothetical protein ACYTDY_09715 [Planctomycetota bacterium]|jgi:hypothetical protein